MAGVGRGDAAPPATRLPIARGPRAGSSLGSARDGVAGVSAIRFVRPARRWAAEVTNAGVLDASGSVVGKARPLRPASSWARDGACLEPAFPLPALLGVELVRAWTGPSLGFSGGRRLANGGRWRFK